LRILGLVQGAPAVAMPGNNTDEMPF